MKKYSVCDVLKNKNQKIELIGWVDSRRDHGKLVFIDLRDRTGIVQVVFGPEIELAKKLRLEYLIKINGLVKERPANLVNLKIETGQFEIEAYDLEIISESKELSIPIDTSGYEINEETRMKYRYLDLRRKRLTQNILIRSKIIKFIRDFMHEKEFVEVETPIISKSTPEGARDYLIPSRIFKGKFYALPQSPQQYKQLLMVAGFEKYFQIAKCFRDEDTRGDRQPEFTQLDIEMSFINQDDVLNLIEELYIKLVEKFYPNKKIKQIPFPRLNYSDVMQKYNSDKPDLREDKNNPDELAFAFIVNFPMFEWKETEKRWDAVHHPFTMPQVKDLNDFWNKFKNDPSKILAYQYDLVLNGYEIGGGSIRTTDPKLLFAIFEAMGNNPEDIKIKFNQLLEAFEYGVPPHGGIASGLDRVLAILQNEPNIREVIAFPKTGEGYDPMMDSPSDVSEDQLKELGIKIDIN
ncbi:MAG: aspartate--tRNA ligase [bacterium]|nr:aspartate--tRNA ligase [Patescibacteria group bacterium]MDW8279821.1 aspartate--tRNA ligase [bacterium]